MKVAENILKLIESEFSHSELEKALKKDGWKKDDVFVLVSPSYETKTGFKTWLSAVYRYDKKEIEVLSHTGTSSYTSKASRDNGKEFKTVREVQQYAKDKFKGLTLSKDQ